MKEYHSGLDEKIHKNNINNYTIIENLTVWSDLLGFGKMFSKTNWEMEKSDWEKVGQRLKNFYEQHYSNICSLNEYIFILNDGLVRTIPIDRKDTIGNELFQVSLWLRDIVICHTKVNKVDKIGARTVLSYGERFINSFIENICLEDLVQNYTKADRRNSSYPKEIKEHRLLDNPVQLQMNTALSKSYILEEMGSKKGLKGSHLYIDESFFNFVKELVKDDEMFIIIEKDDIFAVECTLKDEVGRKWVFGLKRSKPIIIDEDIIKTVVFRIEKFYPHDENPDKFYFKLF